MINIDKGFYRPLHSWLNVPCLQAGDNFLLLLMHQVTSSIFSLPNPAHIHATMLEPDGKYYYIEEFHFIGDPLLDRQHNEPSPRGGKGIVVPHRRGNRILVQRDIVLGLNVPGYPGR